MKTRTLIFYFSLSAAVAWSDQYWAPPSFKGIFSAKLEHLAAMGKLIKMKRKYAAATSTLSERRKFCIPERRDRVSARIEHDDIRFLSEFEIDLMLAKMRSMTPQEAAAAAAQAVAEAEAAMAEAEEAVREAEAAEADAEAAEAYAEAALRTLRRRKTRKMMLHA